MPNRTITALFARASDWLKPNKTTPTAVAAVSTAGPSVPSLAGGPAKCDGCGVQLNPETERMVRFQMGLMDDARRTLLTTTYGGVQPDVLCAAEWIAALGVLNAGVTA